MTDSVKPSNSEKIQKVLAQEGLGSRREIETWIAAGRIKVNDKIAKVGDRIANKDKITIDGRPFKRRHYFGDTENKTRVLIYHKPVGLVCTRSDPEGRETVFKDLPRLRGARWIMVGRLDLNTAGLLLFTTNGELANRLMHPSYEIEREYAVRVLGTVSQDIITRLLKGVRLETGWGKFDSVTDAGGEGANHWYHVVLHEGQNREVRRLWESQGVTVSRLIRIRYGNVQLSRMLRPGNCRYLEPDEAQGLLQLVKINGGS